MKATGIVRRIDDLGRVVIPKEIRRTMRIREGDPLCTLLLHRLKFKRGLGLRWVVMCSQMDLKTSFSAFWRVYAENVKDFLWAKKFEISLFYLLAVLHITAS